MQWRTRLKRLPLGGVVLALLSILVAVVFSTVNFGASLGHVNVKMLSGSPGGNYAAVVDRLSARATRLGGRIDNVASRGSVDNVQRLVEAARSCEVHFALIQDGTPLPEGEQLELLGRLPRGETLFIIGRDAAKLTKFAEIQGKKIGLGPKGSGADHLGRSILESPDLKPLGLQLENHELAEQVELLSSGALDLGVFVMDEDAALITNALKVRKLEPVSIEQLAVIPERLPVVSNGTLRAGRYDALALIPPRDHPVLRVDTLVVSNKCASRSVEIGVLRVLTEEMPGFANDKRNSAVHRSLVSKEFLANGGPGFADEYVPWLVDIMPLGNWFYIVMVISILMNASTLLHKVRLWRVDANRDKAFQIVRDALGEQLTPREIHALEPTAEHRAKREKIDAAMTALDALRIKTRKHQNSMAVPMGAEWMYRYEEEQMELLLDALRVFHGKLQQPSKT